jgi:hypothetical protein
MVFKGSNPFIQLNNQTKQILTFKNKHMITLNKLGTNTIRFIPRQGIPTKVIIRDEQTKQEEVFEEFEVETVGYYTDITTLKADWIDGRKYQLTVMGKGDVILYRDLIFITTQDIETYSENNINGEAKEETKKVGSKDPIYKII